MNAVPRGHQSNNQAGITSVFGGGFACGNEGIEVAEILSPVQANVKFNAVVVHSNDLINSNRESRLQICKIIRNNINSLIVFTNSTIVQKESEEALLVGDFHLAQSNSAAVAQQLNKCKSTLDTINTQLTHANSVLDGLNSERKKLMQRIAEVQRLIEEEREKRKNAALDTLIPFYGLIDGLIKGQPKRAIPGYSAVVGIDSAVHQDKETYEKQLSERERELSETKARIAEISKQRQQATVKKSQSEGELLWLQSREKSLEQEINRCDKDLTQLRGLLLHLRETVTRYHFLKMDVGTIEDFVDVDLLDASTISAFINDITKAKTAFLKITGV